MPALPDQPATLTLDQLLHRDDIWRGHNSPPVQRQAVDTGHPELNDRLQHNGWPLGALVEICQQRYQGEWRLLLPALAALDDGLLVLLNPPAEPFSQAMIQGSIDLDRLVVIRAPGKSEFLSCYRELARTASCAAILGWQPPEYFTYTELRKCLLAAADGTGLYNLFRPSSVQQQSSPAQLRLFCQMIPDGLEVTIFKQKGVLQRHQPRPIVLPLPARWQAAAPYPALDGSTSQARRSQARIFHLRGNR